MVERGAKALCWVKLGGGNFRVPDHALERFDVEMGSRLLVLLGSGLALGFSVCGPIVEAAKRPPDIPVFA